MDEEVGGGEREVRAQMRELKQKLAMVEQAVNDKEEELRDLREALKNAKEGAESDLLRERQAFEEADLASKQEIAELQEEVKGLGDCVGEYKEALAQQEMKAELTRLQSVETLREKFDGE